jgi:hypothetical protein
MSPVKHKSLRSLSNSKAKTSPTQVKSLDALAARSHSRKAPSSERKFMSLIKQAALTPFCRVLKTQKLFQLDRSHAFHYIFHSGQQQLVVGAKGNFYFIWTGERTSAFYLAGAPPPPKSFAASSAERNSIFSAAPPAGSLCLHGSGCSAFCS